MRSVLEGEKVRNEALVGGGRQRELGLFIISGPVFVEVAQRWADHCKKCYWLSLISL